MKTTGTKRSMGASATASTTRTTKAATSMRPTERGERVISIQYGASTLVLIEGDDALIHVPALPLGERYRIVRHSSLVRA